MRAFMSMWGIALCACGVHDAALSTQESTSLRGIPPKCQSFRLEGLHYSPGGSTLPNRCAPFDPVTNNPYAIRCIDAMPNYHTPYPGDDSCILPPPPEQGIQVGVHPQGAQYSEDMTAGDLSAYFDPPRVQPFEIAPGSEILQLYESSTPNDVDRAYYRVDARMRPGSHHLGTVLTDSPAPEGWRAPNNAEDIAQSFDLAHFRGFLFNSQRPAADRPVTSLDIAPEDAHLGKMLSAHSGLTFGLHHFNVEKTKLLREVWINVWWQTSASFDPIVDFIASAPLHVEPGETREVSSSLVASGDVRILLLYGHRHAWTSRFRAWVTRGSGDEQLVYDSYDWREPPTYSYDTLSQNPPVHPEVRRDGAASGVLELHQGDELHFGCTIEVTQQRAAALGVPLPDQAITFGNRTFGADMCLLNGQVVGASLASP